MRLTIFLLLASCLAVQATGYAQKVTLSARNASMESVLTDIKKQTGYFFMYDTDLLKKSGTVSIDVKNAALDETLKQVTAGKPLSYKVIDKTVIISEARAGSTAQQVAITGTVLSKEGPGKSNQPLPGVVVTIKGTKQAVSTNEKGVYFIKAPSDATLIFSMVGFGPQEVAINGNKVVDVVLIETAGELQEVIITGYGTKETRENQVGSAYQVNRKDLDRKPVNRIDAVLEGLVPGLQFEVQDGGTSSIRPRYQTRIRGDATISSSGEPLWVVDGVPIYTGDETNMITGVNTSISPLTYINPNDIESVTVLKDATATSIYGANGANGVILITTKKGVKNDNRFSYGFRSGINLLNDNRFQVLNASEYRELLAESFANNTALTEVPEDKGTSTDWYDVFFRNGITSQHDLSLSGGSEKTRYYLSGAYFNEKPIMIKNSTDRFSSRLNLDQNVNKSIDVFFNLGGSYNINRMFNPGNSYYVNRPIDSPFNPDGSFVMQFYNKLADAEHNDDYQKTMAAFGRVGGTVRILPFLSFTTTNGIDYSSVNENRYSSIYTFTGRNDAYAYKAQSTFFYWNSQQRLNFNKKIDKHDISALVGVEAGSRDRRSLGSQGSKFAHDDIREVTYAANRTGSSSAEEETELSYYGQLRYSFFDKYHLIGSFRGDGNSDFGSDVKWATFKSIGASWTISNEDFWKIKQIEFAKFKISYGTNGNSRIGAQVSKGIYGFNVESSSYNGNLGAVMTSGENPKLSWETTTILNTGLSIGLFKRVSLELEYYDRKTEDLLDQVDVSRTTGFPRIYQNIGAIRNRGIELTLNTKNIVNDNFEWRTSFNLAHNRNKILELYNGNDKISGNFIRRVGEDLGTHYLIRWAGVDPRDGAPLWYDARGNITREFDLNNRVLAGKTTPDFFGGMTNTVQYKNFSLSAMMIYNVGGSQFSVLQRDAESDGRNLLANNQSRNQLDRWRESGDLALAPKTILGENANAGRNSTRFLHDKTALRIQNISLNYELPQALLSKIRLNSSSVYLQADNVAFFTPYKTASGRNNYRNSFSPYPQPLVLSFGINVGL